MPEVKIPSLCEGCSGLSSFNDENDVHCECGKQIVWFFEKPTVIVCERWHRQIQGRRLDPVRVRFDTQHMLGEGLDQHLLVFRAAAHQRAHHAGGLGVLQHHVDVGIADAALQGRAFELQPRLAISPCRRCRNCVRWMPSLARFSVSTALGCVACKNSSSFATSSATSRL